MLMPQIATCRCSRLADSILGRPKIRMRKYISTLGAMAIAIVAAGCTTTGPSLLGLAPVKQDASEVFLYTKYRALGARDCKIQVSIDGVPAGTLSNSMPGPFFSVALTPGNHQLLAKNDHLCDNSPSNLPTDFYAQPGLRTFILVDDQSVNGITLPDQVRATVVNERVADMDLREVLPVYRSRNAGRF